MLACAWFNIEPPSKGLFFLSREDVDDLPPLDTEAGGRWLLDFVGSVGGVDLTVFDNIMSLTRGVQKEEEAWQALKPLVLQLTRQKIDQLWVHHTGHESSRSYGTKAQEWQMDTVIVGSRSDLPHTEATVSLSLAFPKVRRRTPQNRGDFERVDIGLVDGQWMTSMDPVGSTVKVGLPSSAMLALRQLNKVISNHGELLPASDQIPSSTQGVSVERWREHAYKAGISSGGGNSARRKAFGRAIGTLTAAKLVSVWEPYAWLSGP